MTHLVTVVPGEGIGPEITEGTLKVLKASGADLDFDILNTSTSDPNRFVEDVIASALKSNALLKGPLGTPLGGGFKSLNVTLRNQLQLYANLRPIKELPGIGTRVVPSKRNEGKIIDFLLVRENMEDLYIGQERTIAPGVVVADKVMTLEGCERIIRASFEMARQRAQEGDHRKVCCAHKANILKQTEGMLLSLFRKIAPEYPDVLATDLIVDNAAQQIVINPHDLEVIFMSNLHGDILSDEAAGIIGGLGLAGSANIGSEHAMFEAVHGTAPDIAGKGIANPTSLMLSSVMMLSYLGEEASAIRMLNGMYAVYEQGEFRTGDVARNTPHASSTSDFTDAVVRAIQNNESPEDERFQVLSLPQYRLPHVTLHEFSLNKPINTSKIELQVIHSDASLVSKKTLQSLGEKVGLRLESISQVGNIQRVIFLDPSGALINHKTVPLLDAAISCNVDVRGFYLIHSD
jgi:isocitrate/isopropylmalate dehydrogenase